LVTSSLIRETTENESANEGYKFGQEEETYNIVAAHGCHAADSTGKLAVLAWITSRWCMVMTPPSSVISSV